MLDNDKQILDFETAKGKTIDKIAFKPNVSDVCILFSDGSFIVLSPKTTCSSCDRWIQTDEVLDGYDQNALGLLIETEFKEWQKNRDERIRIFNETRERELLNKLKAKYEGDK